MRYPRVDVYVRPSIPDRGDDGQFDRVERVEVDGVAWPVIAADWNASNDRHGTTITLTVRGQLRLHELPAFDGRDPQDGDDS